MERTVSTGTGIKQKTSTFKQQSHIFAYLLSAGGVVSFVQTGRLFYYFKQTAVTAAGESLCTEGPSSDLPDGGCVWKANVKALKVSNFSNWLPMSTWQLLLMSSVNHCAGFWCLILLQTYQSIT